MQGVLLLHLVRARFVFRDDAIIIIIIVVMDDGSGRRGVIPTRPGLSLAEKANICST
jgi:hypothetical protein